MEVKLFDQLSQSQIAQLRNKATEYNPDVFSNALKSLEKEVEMYDAAGKDFRSDYLSARRSYESLSTINNWMKKYNCTVEYLDSDVVYCKNVVRVKAYFDQTYVKLMKFEDYVMYSGIFTPVDTYIIPLKLLNIELPDVGSEFNQNNVMKIVNKRIQDIELHPENKNEKLPSIEDANYGTIRIINSTHCAVVAKHQLNPFAISIRSACNWNFIRGDGSSC